MNPAVIIKKNKNYFGYTVRFFTFKSNSAGIGRLRNLEKKNIRGRRKLVDATFSAPVQTCPGAPPRHI
jgi:hypothetical protein